MSLRGLSPRVRGNPHLRLPQLRTRGSIPACAGEPPTAGKSQPAGMVYPRVCGGTRQALHFLDSHGGLSPRVRGNLLHSGKAGRLAGSIPACAGEPRNRRRSSRRREVYPRVCGGTDPHHQPAEQVRGLSPRVRGNPQVSPVVVGVGRSIPACAGEPRVPCAFGGADRVYPRVCGGTTMAGLSTSFSGGLSPRVRGNRANRSRARSRGRSIPACAGEPSGAAGSGSGAEVYPRVCGEPC